MGLNMVVGALVDTEDDDYTEMVRADFVAIGELLERAGARQWTEPDLDEEEGAEFEAWGYSGLHTVRRLAVSPSTLQPAGACPSRSTGPSGRLTTRS
ncbi:hypothetical protein [Streptomyces sp. NPDC055692]|uniref:hypothetical protein n=1 Tax=Streptomyces sp. NPDC055692 TaxID=3155683 RepID=UPI003432E671